MSYQFYEAQQAGKLLPSHRVHWRGDSALQDRAPNGASLVGGWFDAGGMLPMESVRLAGLLVSCVGRCSMQQQGQHNFGNDYKYKFSQLWAISSLSV